MRRSTRISIKRTSIPLDSSDEDEPKKPKPEPTPNNKHKLSYKKPNQQNGSIHEPKEIKSHSKTIKTAKISQKLEKNANSDGSSSESDIENYLQPVDQIDLNSTFFQIKPDEKKSFEAIENSIFAGIDRLSNSESESDAEEIEASPIKKPKTKKTKSKDPKPTPINFQHVQDYTKKLEEAKKLVEKYEANKKKKQDKQKISADKKSEEEKQDISNLLALGETKLESSGELQTSMHSSDSESFSEFEKEDWEEVEERDVQDTRESIMVPKGDLQITVEMPTVIRKKKGKDLVASMKRRLNRIRKENQVLVHKVHLLCWLGHGNYINEVLNSEGLLAMVLSIIPTQHCYQSGQKNLNYFEGILKWYNSMMPNIEKRTSKDMTLEQVLKLQIIRKEAFSKKMLVYIFLCILRSLGIQCRLVLSFQVTPLRPPASELHSLSKKNNDKKDTKEEEAAGNFQDLSQESQDMKMDNEGKCKIENEIQNDEKEEEKKSEKDMKNPSPSSKESIKNKNKNEKKDNKQIKPRKTKDKSEALNLETESEKPEETKSKKPKKELSKSEEKENSKNKGHSTEKPFIENPKTKKSSARNAKTNKQESLKVEPNAKPKTRSQSTKEEKSQDKTRSDLLNTKPSTRSQSASQLDAEETDIQNNLQIKTRKSLSLRTKNNNSSSLRKIPQVDGADDSDDEPATSRKTTNDNMHSKRIKSLPDYTEVDSDDDFTRERPKRSVKSNTQKAKTKANLSEKSKAKPERKKPVSNRTSQNESDDDSDYTPQPTKKKHDDSDDEFYESNVRVTERVRSKKRGGDVAEPKAKKGFDVWVEVYLESEEKWTSVDVVKGQVHCVSELHSKASHPITYVVAWNNDNSLKDITQRYCPNFNTVTRKLRIDKKWWDSTIQPFEGQKTVRDRKEDEELAQMQLQKPLPGTISEYKNHPLYVIKRHLLQFEGLYPPEPITLGFVRGEAVYSRECVHRLYTREVWYKRAKVVKPGEVAYKILKRPKWDKINRKILKGQPLEIFGQWQVEDYVPPAAENGLVPRNEYGNVELFQSCMLPKGTVHLQLPGLNKLARRMNIDCAPAMVGFDFHSGWNHPVFDGYVVCEEHSESLIAAWYMEQEEREKREQEKMEKRVYGNWKKLIKGLLIRERLKARYDFGVPSQAGTAAKKRKSKGPKFVSKKRRICSENESYSESE